MERVRDGVRDLRLLDLALAEALTARTRLEDLPLLSMGAGDGWRVRLSDLSVLTGDAIGLALLEDLPLDLESFVGGVGAV